MAIVTDIKRSGVESLKLTLDKEEIQCLIDIFNHIGGGADKSRRGISHKILLAFRDADVNIEPSFAKDLKGNIYFDDIKHPEVPVAKPVKTRKVVWNKKEGDWDEVPY